MNKIEQKIDDLLVDWEAARLDGRELSVLELCAEHPELASQVEQKIAVLKQLSWVVDPDALVADELTEFNQGHEETVLRDTDVTVAEFVQAIADSGLLGNKDLARLDQFVPPDRQQRAFELASELVRQNVITPYQAKVILERGDSPLLLDRYVILDSIGCGGMGIVFKALQRSLERVVAVKVLPKHAVDSPEKVERFQREMRAAARLSHPNVVQAYDAHESNGVYFFAMEYVSGSDLAVLVREDGPLSVDASLEILSQVTAGLADAHAKGIVHRDVKPSNILLSDEGVAKVLDLGLARTRELAQSTTVNDLTRDGLAMGTVTYMSPEQAFDAKDADERSDIYSLGCTLYFLLHGRAMFEAPNSVQTVVAHRETPAPMLGKGRNDVPVALEELFQSMVAKDPAARPASMEEVRSSLLEIRGVGADYAEPYERPRRHQPVTPTDDSLTDDSRTDDLMGTQRDRQVPAEHEKARSNWLLWSIAAVVLLAMLGFAATMLGPNFDAEPDTRSTAVELLKSDEVSLLVDMGDGEYQVDYEAELPEEPFEISGAILYSERSPSLERFEELATITSVILVSQSDEPVPLGDLPGRQKFQQLEDLTLIGWEISEELMDWVGGLSGLRELDLMGCELPDNGFKNIVQLQQLSGLILAQTNVENDDLPALRECKQLSMLDLSNTNITNQGLHQIQGLPTLKELALTGVDLGDEMNWLAELPTLRKLYVDGTDLNDGMLASIVAISKLKLLHAGHTKLSSNGLAQLAAVDGLRELGVEGLAVEQSLDTIERLPSLRVLNADDSDLTDKGLEKLSRLKSLKSLSIANTSVSDAAIERFMLRLPACDVFTEVVDDAWSIDGDSVE